MPSFPKKITQIPVGARDSPLSRAQFQEVAQELYSYLPHLVLEPIFLKTRGDKDLITSLRTLGKTDFFTREIDHLQLQRGYRLSIHSAKDLPDPLPEGLVMAALTQGVDSSDSLVFRAGDSIASLPKGAVIATSSESREKRVKQLRSDLCFTDIRGTIGQRLEKLFSGEIDGVVIAEAALLRLGLTSLSRIKLPGDSTPLQGQLAVLAHQEDEEAREWLKCIDVRYPRSILYLGLDPKNYICRGSLFHYPVITIEARSHHHPACQKALQALPLATHLIFTSKSAVHAWIKLLNPEERASMASKKIFAVGKVTGEALQKYGLLPTQIAKEESAEGVIELLEKENLSHAFFLWPHSALSRPLLSNYLKNKKIPYVECDLYDTVSHKFPITPDIQNFKEIAFTSPSTVDGFLKIFSSLPEDKWFFCQGKITRRYLEEKMYK